MQRVMGLLSMQARGTSPEVAAALRVATDRVRVIARIQERLLVRDSCTTLDACGFLESLVADVRTSLEGLQPVMLVVEAESHILSGEQASAIGLVTNELITNALKHAFPDGRKGTLRIGFRRDGAEYVLLVADDGVGWSQSDQDAVPDGSHSGGLGQRLTAALAMQLHGRIAVGGGDPSGTVVTMRFPLEFHADTVT
jgi:two-component sensor histidine kinase